MTLFLSPWEESLEADMKRELKAGTLDQERAQKMLEGELDDEGISPDFYHHAMRNILSIAS